MHLSCATYLDGASHAVIHPPPGRGMGGRACWWRGDMPLDAIRRRKLRKLDDRRMLASLPKVGGRRYCRTQTTLPRGYMYSHVCHATLHFYSYQSAYAFAKAEVQVIHMGLITALSPSRLVLSLHVNRTELLRVLGGG